MAIKVFADGANLEGMLDMHDNGNVQGFTTNPSLMKAGGVTDYRAFAKTVLEHITDVSVSFEVFADDEAGMEAEAREIATWADNVYVKIPALNTKGESTAALVKRLCRWHQGECHHHLHARAGRRVRRCRLCRDPLYSVYLCRPNRRYRCRSAAPHGRVRKEGCRQARRRGSLGIHA